MIKFETKNTFKHKQKLTNYDFLNQNSRFLIYFFSYICKTLFDLTD